MKKYFAFLNSEVVIPAQAGLRVISLRHPIQTFIKIYTHFASDSLYRNSIYLMLSTGVMAFFGFFFWMINARIYTPEQVGIATTLISVMGLIAGFSNLGLNVGLVRFLPSSKNKNELINSSFLISSITAFVLAIIFLAGLHIFSPKLLFVRENPVYAISFVLFVVALANNTIVDALFIAYRSAKYILIKNSVMSIAKLVLPLALVAFSAYGIFAAVGLANIMAIVLSVFILIKLFNFKIAYKHNLDEIKKISYYSFGNYVAGFLYSLPVMVLPIIITNKIGAAEAGYFYIAFTIASFIFIIPQATTQSLFAEGSHSDKNMKIHFVKASKITILILVPTVIFAIIFGNYILLAFGKNYLTHAFLPLQFLILSSIFISINGVIGSIFRVKNRIKELIGIGVFNMLIILLLSYLFMESKLFGMGLAWLLGQFVVSIVYLVILSRLKFYNKI